MSYNGKKRLSHDYCRNHDDCDNYNRSRSRKRRARGNNKKRYNVQRRVYKSSKSQDSLKMHAAKRKRTNRNPLKWLQLDETKTNDAVAEAGSCLSSDSIVYVGTFYYKYPMIDLTTSESSLEDVSKGPSTDEKLDDNVITILPASRSHLITPKLESVVSNGCNDIVCSNELSVSNIDEHRSYPMRMDEGEALNDGTSTNVVKFVKEIVNNLSDVVVSFNEAKESNDGDQEIVLEIQLMDVDEGDPSDKSLQ